MADLLVWKILLVDDDEDDYLLTREMLSAAQGRKIELTWASTFEEGRQAIAANGFDVLLVDYDLGLHTGLELTREVLSKVPGLPIILLTGRGSYEVDLEAMQAGASLYLTKNEANSLLLERSIRYAIERKQADVALRASEERFRQLADSMPQLVWTANPDGMVDYFNRRWQEFDGIRLEPDNLNEKVKWTWAPVLHPEDVERTLAAWNQALSSGVIYQIEHRVRMIDGTYRWFLSRGMPARDAEGRIVKWYGTATNIHDQKMVEEASLEREKIFQQLVSVMPVAMYTCDTVGAVTFYNAQAVELWGREPVLGPGGDLYGGGVLLREMNGNIMSKDKTPMAEVLRSRIGVRNRRFILERPDGTDRVISANIEPLISPDGRFMGAINVFQDITGHKFVEQLLAEGKIRTQSGRAGRAE